MAILDAFPGMTVEVVVDGQPLHEYRDPDLDDDDEYTKTSFIEATSEKRFSIRAEVTKGFKFLGDCVRLKIFMDVHDGRMMHTEPAQVKKLGSLEIQISHARYGSKTTREYGSKPTETGILAEKALKGQTLSHSISLSDATRNPDGAVKYWNAELIEGVRCPFATFVFTYRSMEGLKSMLIVPRTPTPPPLEERDFDTLSAEELRAMQKELKAIKDKQAAAVKIKRERADHNPRPRKAARPSQGDTLLELDGDDRFRQSSAATLPAKKKVMIELD